MKFMIDRSAAIFRAKEPFVAWLNHLPDNAPDMKFDLSSVNDDGYLFLIPEVEDAFKRLRPFTLKILILPVERSTLTKKFNG